MRAGRAKEQSASFPSALLTSGSVPTASQTCGETRSGTGRGLEFVESMVEVEIQVLYCVSAKRPPLGRHAKMPPLGRPQQPQALGHSRISGAPPLRKREGRGATTNGSNLTQKLVKL
ncbi:hypothetical protein NDU88_005661 [Pleurodeles waltl]|uniref:Uncharacterized protein n=1 Tax=Pleurodeles waltl TaxID=8319 RepID=A0AAV7VNU7_PLEWA|nr:hypothetical protein NDU88_005661 [Pleurodeles waltl]